MIALAIVVMGRNTAQLLASARSSHRSLTVDPLVGLDVARSFRPSFARRRWRCRSPKNRRGSSAWACVALGLPFSPFAMLALSRSTRNGLEARRLESG